MVASIATRKRPRRLDLAQRQEDDSLVAHRGEGVHDKAWQRMAASSGPACSPATGDQGRAGTVAPAAPANDDLCGGEVKRGERGD
jgi:hypothetical protein